LKIFGISVTFFIFIFIFINFKIQYINPLKSKLFAPILIGATISAFLSFFIEEISHPGIGSTGKIMIQYFYWLSVAAFFRHYYIFLNVNEICKYFFFGLACSIIGFFFIRINLSIGLASISTTISRNGFVFDFLASFPFAIFYIYNHRLLKKFTLIFMLISFFLMSMSSGRSGFIILLIEILGSCYLFYPYYRNLFRKLLIPAGLFFLLLLSSTKIEFIDELAYKIEPYNTRVSQLIRQEGEGNWAYDKSLMLRLLMTKKAIEIFKLHPVFGIGPNMFTSYDSELSALSKYSRLSNYSDDYYNTRSTHGSYYQVLAEFGFFVFVFIIIILFVPLIYLFKTLFNNQMHVNSIFLISLLGISLHFIAISALTGTIPWVVIGIAWNVYDNNRLKLNT
tara:strand:- start:5643 stop:6824 length:1182 start_codon:yes stop_codon:yes gene_type:complete